jgi:hypothetical protein
MNDFLDDTSDFKLLTLKDLSYLLSYSDKGSVISWLDSMQIKLHNIGTRKNVVFRIDYEVALMTQKGIELKNKFPSNWRELLWFYTPNDKIMNLVCFQIEQKTIEFRKYKSIELKSEKEKKFLKGLSDE